MNSFFRLACTWIFYHVRSWAIMHLSGTGRDGDQLEKLRMSISKIFEEEDTLGKLFERLNYLIEEAQNKFGKLLSCVSGENGDPVRLDDLKNYKIYQLPDLESTIVRTLPSNVENLINLTRLDVSKQILGPMVWEMTILALENSMIADRRKFLNELFDCYSYCVCGWEAKILLNNIPLKVEREMSNKCLLSCLHESSKLTFPTVTRDDLTSDREILQIISQRTLPDVKIDSVKKILKTNFSNYILGENSDNVFHDRSRLNEKLKRSNGEQNATDSDRFQIFANQRHKIMGVPDTSSKIWNCKDVYETLDSTSSSQKDHHHHRLWNVRNITNQTDDQTRCKFLFNLNSILQNKNPEIDSENLETLSTVTVIFLNVCCCKLFYMPYWKQTDDGREIACYETIMRPLISIIVDLNFKKKDKAFRSRFFKNLFLKSNKYVDESDLGSLCRIGPLLSMIYCVLFNDCSTLATIVDEVLENTL